MQCSQLVDMGQILHYQDPHLCHVAVLQGFQSFGAGLWGCLQPITLKPEADSSLETLLPLE